MACRIIVSRVYRTSWRQINHIIVRPTWNSVVQRSINKHQSPSSLNVRICANDFGITYDVWSRTQEVTTCWAKAYGVWGQTITWHATGARRHAHSGHASSHTRLYASDVRTLNPSVDWRRSAAIFTARRYAIARYLLSLSWRVCPSVRPSQVGVVPKPLTQTTPHDSLMILAEK